MMSDIAIRAESLGKMYRIGARRAPYGRFTETLMRALVAPMRHLRDLGKPVPAEELIWALQDVSFEIKRGEAVGIIGRNGAGKSTLLKVLSRITEPTTGRVELHGRVGSLLEVGTGFHPELTGRENIYLNGAILGMKRAEIQSRFDEIVAFAEIEKFLDTPVKRYSSGMYVRLAFAVAAHLEHEILLVDEVLAVGDAAFQRKCLGKMGSVAREGRTVLFVSHNMAAVRHLCQRGLVLKKGIVSFIGTADQAIESYLSQLAVDDSQNSDGACSYTSVPSPGQRFAVLRVEILDESGTLKQVLSTGDYARFRVVWHSAEFVEKGGVELGIHTLDGVPLIQYSTRPVSDVDVQFRVGLNTIELEFPQFPLAAGQYYLTIALTRPMLEWLYHNDRFGLLQVAERDVFRSGVPVTASRALLVVPHRWITSS